MGEPELSGLEPEEIETVGSPGKPRRIYSYSTPDSATRKWTRVVGETTISGEGRFKVGETTRPTAKERIKEQLGTAFPNLDGIEIQIDQEAVRKDGTFFRDHDVHDVLVKHGIKRVGGEWFEAKIDEINAAIVAVRNGASFESNRTRDFPMRPEQEEAVALTAGYFELVHSEEPVRPPKFLWNAKMRFGKTFTTYQLAREMGWTKVLVLTYKPAVQTAWRDDLLGHVDFEGWNFIDRDTPVAVSDDLIEGDDPVVWFASFQDLGGKTVKGDIKAHNQTIYLTDWDCIVIDEYHFGAWRDSARELYDPADEKAAELEEPDEPVTETDLGLKANHFLYLSGTPFRAITNGEFNEDQVFNWTYPQEQEAKQEWNEADGLNPYSDLPGMEIYCYKMGEEAVEWAEDGEFNSFSLSDYFNANRANKASKATGPDSHVFEDPDRVVAFLDMLRGKLSDQMKLKLVTGKKAPFPYESQDFAKAVRHSVWYLPNVASCYAMRDMLAGHSSFKDYEVQVAAGAKAGMGAAAKPPVEDAIARAEASHKPGSITLSCGKLMTGVTVPEWSAIFMLRSLKSPESYFQAAFRVQSPWRQTLSGDEIEVLKPTCFVFEFDPNRALTLVAEYGIKLGSASAATVEPKEAIDQLLAYLPIFGFDNGAMLPLSASEILDQATSGIGATALAQRWNSPLLVNVNEQTLAAILSHPGLLEVLDKVEDFRALVDTGEQVVTSTKELKRAKREQSGELDDEQKKLRKETNKQRKEIREKLQKFLAKIPVFMYSTDFREEALKHVIESVDPSLFRRVTGLTVADFRTLSDLGLFNAQNMNQAIYQFRLFERASLEYADAERHEGPTKIGLWDSTDEI